MIFLQGSALGPSVFKCQQPRGEEVRILSMEPLLKFGKRKKSLGARSVE